MFTVTLLAAPSRADLPASLVDDLRSAWNGGHVIWLAQGIAAEFPLAAEPADFWQVWERLQAEGFDLAIQPTRGRRKAVLLADMDSTMIQQECIDELADFAGVGQRVATITAQAMNGELNFHEALLARVNLLAGLPETAIGAVLDSRITLAPAGGNWLPRCARKEPIRRWYRGASPSLPVRSLRRSGFRNIAPIPFLPKTGC